MREEHSDRKIPDTEMSGRKTCDIKISDKEIQKVLRFSMKMTTTVPDPELNTKLKAELYRQEAVLRKQPTARTVSLWYVPMILNTVMFSLLALLNLIMIENRYLSYLAAGICIYFGAAGILLTIVGVKRANIKEEITIRMEKEVC